MKEPQSIRIQLTNDFATPEIEELERQGFKTDMLYIIVSTLLIAGSIICAILSIVLSQIWIGIVGLLLWTVEFAASMIWLQVKKNICIKLCQAEEELLEQKIKEKENLK